MEISSIVRSQQVVLPEEMPRNDVKTNNSNNNKLDIVNDTVEIHTKVKEMKDEDWEKMIAKINKALDGSGRHFKYEVHKPTNEVIISVIDNETDKVIKEIPPKKLLDVVAKIWEMAGLFVDERR